MSANHNHLLPEPQSVRRHEDSLQANRLHFGARLPPRSAVAAAMDYLADRGIASPPEASTSRPASRPIRLEVHADLPPEGYELLIASDGVEINAANRRGFLYGAVTLRQWLKAHGWRDGDQPVPGVAIRDRPDFARRGFLLDISRNKVPQMKTLLWLVDLLADLKYNELQLYMEHTFAYPGHERVWEGVDPLTPGQVRQLDGYCRLRGVELVPNQNSFGHLHRWLIHQPYRQLAECPDGIEHPFSAEIEPFSLCPTDPDSLSFLGDLYGKLLPSFSSARFHVGFDEAFEIGRGRSKAACSAEGLAAVVLRFLNAVRTLAKEHGRRVMIWADMLVEHRELLDEIARDVILCEWGYEAGHPFREDSAVLGATGCDVYLCPGTSAWSSFAGRGRNMVANVGEAAEAGLATGATGYLLTEWGDHGHLQPLSASYPALAAGAAFAWHGSAARRREGSCWADAIDRWILDAPESGLGSAAIELSNVYTVTGASQKNGTALFHLLMSPDDGLEHRRYRGLSQDGLERAAEAVKKALAAMPPNPSHPVEAHCRDESIWVADTLLLACEVGKARLDSPFAGLPDLPESARNRILQSLEELAERRRGLWLERNRTGGLEDSLRQFTRLGRRLRTG